METARIYAIVTLVAVVALAKAAIKLVAISLRVFMFISWGSYWVLVGWVALNRLAVQ